MRPPSARHDGCAARPALLAVVIALSGTVPAHAATTTAGRPGEGILTIATGGESGIEIVPAVSTAVAAHLVGFVSHVAVRQRFNNPYRQPLEAVYVFPLPHDAAVSGMTITVGDRTIQAEIKRRQEASEIYHRARREGRTAGLLEQERPNVFTQSVANIPPGATVLVELTYDVALDYRDGAYEFVFPMVVGPRYIPGQPDGRPPIGHGTSPDTDQVPDASRITPPAVGAGQRSGRSVQLTVNLDPGSPIRALTSPTHEIGVERQEEDGTAVRVELVGRDRIPNRDFVLRYRLASDAPVATLFAQPGKKGAFALFIEPPPSPRRSQLTPKELVFLVDTSGSMKGLPLEAMKRAMRHAITHLGPRDTFRILQFASTTDELGGRAQANTAAGRRRALAAIDRMEASGGTEIMTALDAALASPPTDGRLRVVCLLSDGFVGNEKAILAAAAGKLSATRLFAIGIGSSVNRYLLDRWAEVGRGAAQYLLLDAPVEPQIKAFYRRIRSPVLTDIDIAWGDLKASETIPEPVGDLFAGHPIAIVGRFEGRGAGRVVVRGRLGGRPVEYRVPVSMAGDAGDPDLLPRLWARRRIRALEMEALRSDDPRLAEEVTRLGLAHRLITAHTSFIAVDLRRTASGVLRTYVVPVDLPAGVGSTGVTEETGRAVTRAGPAEAAADRVEDEGGAKSGEVVTIAGETVAVSDGWRFAVGLAGGGGLGAPFTGGEDDARLVGGLHLRLQRPAVWRLAFGARLSALFGHLDRAPALAALLFEGAALGLGHRNLELVGGIGPAWVGGDDGGAALGVGAALRLGPVELRYQHGARPGDDAAAATVGVELSF